MATAIRTKFPSERRTIPIDLTNLIADGAVLQTWTAYASRKTTPLSTTLSTAIVAGDSSIDVPIDPSDPWGEGTFLTVDPGSLSEEVFKAAGPVTGGPTIFTVPIIPTAEYAHVALTTTVNYEPGMSDRVLVANTGVLGAGTVVPIDVYRGADGHTYRINVRGLCDDGEAVEGEFDLVVLESAPTITHTQQPDEIRDIPFDFEALLADWSATLTSAIIWVSRTLVTLVGTTFAADAEAGDSIISMTSSPGLGAALTLHPLMANQEKVHASAISGSGPYLVTIDPSIEFDHASGGAISYHPGATSRILSSPTPTTVGTQGIVRAQRGASGHTYQLKMLGLSSTFELLQINLNLAILES